PRQLRLSVYSTSRHCLRLVGATNAEDRRRQVDARRFNAVCKFRSNTSGADASNDLATFHARLFVFENVGHGDHVTFHTLYFGDLDDLTRTVAQTLLMAHAVYRAGDLFADSAYRQVHACHQAHHFQTGDSIARAVGVQRRQRAVVTGIHCLKHVQRFTRTALPDDDAVRTHTQAVDYQVLNRDLPFAFNVGRAAFQRDDVFLPQLQFRRVFNRHNALVVRNKARKHVEQGRFSRASTAGHDDVEPCDDASTHELDDFFRDRAEADQIFEGQRLLEEFTD